MRTVAYERTSSSKRAVHLHVAVHVKVHVHDDAHVHAVDVDSTDLRVQRITMRKRQLRCALWMAAVGTVLAGMFACVGDDPNARTGASANADASAGNDAGSNDDEPAAVPLSCDGGRVACGNECVDLTTNVDHCGKCFAGCGAGTCIGSECAARLVFVTSKIYDGNLGGIDGADKKCNDSAALAKKRGTYKAWLSISGKPVKDRLEHALVPYELPNRAVIANHWTELTSGSIKTPINMDEHTTTVTGGHVWTATTPSGDLSQAAETCNGWSIGTGGAGRPGAIGQKNIEWTYWNPGYTLPCSHSPVSLYCFEQR